MFAYVGSIQNLEDLKVVRNLKENDLEQSSTAEASVLNLRTTTSQKFAAVPRRARI